MLHHTGVLYWPIFLISKSIVDINSLLIVYSQSYILSFRLEETVGKLTGIKISLFHLGVNVFFFGLVYKVQAPNSKITKGSPQEYVSNFSII